MTEQTNRNRVGIKRPDDGDVRVLSDLVEEDESRVSLLPDRVVMVIVVLALAWILILSFFVARMPAK